VTVGNKLALAAVVLALLALLLQFLGRGGERSAGAATTVPGDLGPLMARVAAMEAAVEELRQAQAKVLMSPMAPVRELAVSGADSGSAELARRVEALERAMQALEGSSDEAARSARAATGELVRLLGGRLSFEDAIQRALDRSATEAQRLEALRSLRGQRDQDAIDARLYVLDGMLELARTSQDGETRADVWRQLNHMTDQRLRQPLLDALAFDEHAKAREEAAETLAGFLPDLGIEAALRAAMENDSDAGVRRQAAESLARLR
jgi:hypothetical protein